ncbi:hypothetical protein [Mycolicibacterium moriokaense]|uniref:Uncharacterized protein n=1 Tax=Mycolicibacterium moriokaense TaxID=39691 RepID=A0AAD1M5V9_9MYCO|nr:hypothetical protein [Mycolicibacterium moriokaense]MCV7039868.1 hypothetical protein [Mycolicibacterium moriokaense]BBX01683.1 hypothetical protein MMOR_26190 [Mycolicibacterium moriokaense]
MRQREERSLTGRSHPAAIGGVITALAPLTRRFVVFELFAPSEAVRDRTNRFAESHFGEERVADRSRNDHDGPSPTSTQVIRAFDGAVDFAEQKWIRESSHYDFVTQPTDLAVGKHV